MPYSQYLALRAEAITARRPRSLFAGQTRKSKKAAEGTHPLHRLASSVSSPASGQIDVLLLGDQTQLVHDADVQLPHPLLGDAQLLADLLQRHPLRVVVQPRPHA